MPTKRKRETYLGVINAHVGGGLLSGVLLPLGESNLPKFSSSKHGTDERANYQSFPN